jgi:hypothetical protein
LKALNLNYLTIEIELCYMETPEPDLIHATGYKQPGLGLELALKPVRRGL